MVRNNLSISLALLLDERCVRIDVSSQIGEIHAVIQAAIMLGIFVMMGPRTISVNLNSILCSSSLIGDTVRNPQSAGTSIAVPRVKLTKPANLDRRKNWRLEKVQLRETSEWVDGGVHVTDGMAGKIRRICLRHQ